MSMMWVNLDLDEMMSWSLMLFLLHSLFVFWRQTSVCVCA